jgi:hypothetical protein
MQRKTRRRRNRCTPSPPNDGEHRHPQASPHLLHQKPGHRAGRFHFKEVTMADYFEQTVVQQTIPDADMTALERLLLSRIFQSEPNGDGWYFFAEESPSTMIVVNRAELDAALASSPDVHGAARSYVVEQLGNADAENDEIDLDLSGTSWESFLQDIVKRSMTLRYITVVSAFTCSKMRPDGFGGMAVLITPSAIAGKSTNDILHDFLSVAGLEDGETMTPDEIIGEPPIARTLAPRNGGSL